MSVGDILYGITWYNMPRYDQYIVQTIIRRSQDAVELKGLGVVVCSLEAYLMVWKQSKVVKSIPWSS